MTEPPLPVMLLIYRAPEWGTYELSMLDPDGDINALGQALLARLPAQYGRDAAVSMWRGLASDRLGLLREAQMRIRELELELALRGVDLLAEAAGVVRDSKGREA